MEVVQGIIDGCSVMAEQDVQAIILSYYYLDITELNFRCKGLITLPKEIGLLLNLSELCLSDNQIKSLPAEIGQLDSLKELDLSKNELTHLPAEIWQIHNLRDSSFRR